MKELSSFDHRVALDISELLTSKFSIEKCIYCLDNFPGNLKVLSGRGENIALYS